MPDGSLSISYYDENGQEIKTLYYSSSRKLSQIQIHEYNEASALSKSYTYNTDNVLVYLIEYLSGEDGWIYSLETAYYENGNVEEIKETRDRVVIRHETYDIDGNRI